MGAQLGLDFLDTAIYCSEDAKRIAKRRLPNIIYGFVEGGTAVSYTHLTLPTIYSV